MNNKLKVIALSSVLGLSLLTGCGNSNGTGTVIGGSDISKNSLNNMVSLDSTGTYMIAYENVFKNILNSYELNTKDVKKEFDKEMGKEGISNPMEEMGYEEYKTYLDDYKLSKLQLVMYKDLLDMKDEDILKNYEKEKAKSNYLIVSATKEFLSKNKNAEKEITKDLKNIKGLEDVDKITSKFANQKGLVLENVSLDKDQKANLPDERKSVIESLKKGDYLKEDLTKKEGLTFFYKYVADTEMTEEEYIEKVVFDKVMKENVQDLVSIMEKFNSKNDKDMKFTKELISQIKEEMKLVHEAQELADKDENNAEANQDAVTEKTEEEIKSSAKDTVDNMNKNEVKSEEEEANTFTK